MTPLSQRRVSRAALAGLVAVLACSAARADVTGHVTLKGKPPTLKPIDMSADPKCAAAHPNPVDDPSVVVGDKGELANVVVSLKRADNDPNPTAAGTGTVTLDQKGCMYEPHIVAMQVGQTLEVKNSDPFLHNVHGRPSNNGEFNIGMPNKNGGMPVNPQPKVPEYFPVGCDVHPWMKAWVAVFDHPYFSVTDATGAFDIKGLKDGTYTLTFWHERFGMKESKDKVTVKDGVGTIDFAFDAKDKPAKKPKPAAAPAPAPLPPSQPSPPQPAAKPDAKKDDAK